MAKMLSMDLRSRVVAAVQAGASRRAAASRFGVSASSAVKLLGRVQATGSAAPGQRGRRPGSGKLEPFKAALIGWVETTPDITMPELAERLRSRFGVTVRPSSLSRLLCKAGWTYKKSADGTGSRTRRRRQTAPALVPLDPALAVPASAAAGVH
jgi:transposase